MNRKTILLSVAIVAIMSSVLAVSLTFTAAAVSPGQVLVTSPSVSHAGKPMPLQSQPNMQYNNNNQPLMVPNAPSTNGWNQGPSGGNGMFTHRNYVLPQHGQGMYGHVSINSTQAKAAVEADIPNLKTGTPTSFRTSWVVPVEDQNGVVTSIQVPTINANTSDQAKSIVDQSLANGWSAGEPQLIGATYLVPLLDSSNTTVSYARVDGRRGAIITSPSTTFTVTSDQAKTIVSNAISNFTVGTAMDIGRAWIVSIQYNNNTVMTVILGKINTPTSDDVVTAVKNSLETGWSAGDPTQTRLNYNVAIIDSNGNTIGNIIVNGRTGDILGCSNNPRIGLTGGVKGSLTDNSNVVGNAL
jgi:hypothetical protein